MSGQSSYPPPILTIWRDSVCLADDVDAPHEIRLPIEGEESLGSVTERVLQTCYLPRIAEGKATWIVESGSRALAVIAQQWSRPRFLVSPEEAAVSYVDHDAEWHLSFRYWRQADPEEVYGALQVGGPLPDRFG
jgi:hypothetical protein